MTTDTLLHPTPHLPAADGLNIGALTGLFRNTTNSYKFVFFLALLDLLRRNRFDAERPYTYAEITVEMLSVAWFAHTYFKLSFGSTDQIANKLDALAVGGSDAERLMANHRGTLRAALAAHDLRDAASLMNFVPYRLVRPFVDCVLTTAEKKSNRLNDIILGYVNAQFNLLRPLYRFDGNDLRSCTGIRWHPDWVTYLQTHFRIIQSWTSWHWLGYMQRRNPATPAIATKLFPPAKRDALTSQSKYWRRILQADDARQLRCIYSGEPLAADAFALDHYLPWSFVAHNQLWNLIPTPARVNSSKSNNLPSSDYFSGFVELQHNGLLIAQRLFGAREFGKFTEDYLADLHVSDSAALLDFDQLYGAYEQNLGPLITLATNQGFSPDWRYAHED